MKVGGRGTAPPRFQSCGRSCPHCPHGFCFLDHGSQPKSRLAAVTFARELYCLNRAGAMLNITNQWQVPEIYIFYKSILQEIRSHADTPCAKVSSSSICPFKGYRRKTGRREAETDSRIAVYQPWLWPWSRVLVVTAAY